jgi:sensor c-di-GMP phosphodiesterase-like protein
MVDTATPPEVSLAILLPNGDVIAQKGYINSIIINTLIYHRDDLIKSGTFLSTSRGGHFTSLAISKYPEITDAAKLEILISLIISIICTSFAIFFTIKYMRKKFSLEGRIKNAIKFGKFQTRYQPIIDLSTKKCIGAEALLRWEISDGEFVSPDIFIAEAEKNGLIAPLTDLLFRKVAAEIFDFLKAHEGIHIALNIGASDIQNGRFMNLLGDLIQKHELPEKQVWLEATERSFIDARMARETLDRVRSLGHRVAIDDFGTGYSDLSLLEKLPLDALKIDKSFVDAIGTGAATSVVIPHLVSMAHSLRLCIVAEGGNTRSRNVPCRTWCRICSGMAIFKANNI